MLDWMRELAWKLIKPMIDLHMAEKYLNFPLWGVDSNICAKKINLPFCSVSSSDLGSRL